MKKLRILSMCIYSFVAITVLAIVLGGFYTVNQGDRAVVLRFGKLLEVTEPGFHFKVPGMDTVRQFSVRTQKISQNIDVYSKDIQSAVIRLSINYSIEASKVADIYSRFGIEYVQRIIGPQILAKPKDVFGKYNAVEIVQNREKMAQEILTEFRTQFEGTGVIAESVQIENIDFSDEYEKNVEERMKAEVEVQKVRQNLEREKITAEMLRTQAQGRADARIAEAKAEAESIRITGLAEAEAIKVKTEALTGNANYIKYVEARKWNGVLPQQMIPSGALPVLSVGK